MSIEVLSQDQLRRGSDIAKRGHELSEKAANIDNPTLRGEESLAGGIAGLWRLEALKKVVLAEQIEVISKAEQLAAGVLHDQWREEFFSTDIAGVYTPRIKCLVERYDADSGEIKEMWVNEKDVSESEDVLFAQDIANTSFEHLSDDWKQENLAAAKVIVGIVVKTGGEIDLEDADTYQAMGDEIHNPWLERAAWVPSESAGPFAGLSDKQKEKDIDQLRTALALFPRQEN